jgi:AcrR family transcriptional regulator
MPTDEERRRYDSPVRRQRAAATREGIVAAGAALAYTFPTSDWRGLTFRAVAQRAGVSERTVYRHFATERELHDAVTGRLGRDAGEFYDGLGLAGLADVATRGLAAMSAFSVRPGAAGDPSAPAFAPDRRRRAAFADAVAPAAADWSDAQRAMAAAVLDAVSTGATYERLTTAWKLEPEQATQAVRWAVDVLVEAVRAGRPPGRPAS